MTETITVLCDCGFRLGIQLIHLEEIAAGVWGTINCPQCGGYMNPKIKEAQEKYEK